MLSIVYCVSSFIFSSLSVGHCNVCPSVYWLWSSTYISSNFFWGKKLNINVIYHRNNDLIFTVIEKNIYYWSLSIQSDDVMLTDNIRSYAKVFHYWRVFETQYIQLKCKFQTQPAKDLFFTSKFPIGHDIDVKLFKVTINYTITVTISYF